MWKNLGNLTFFPQRTLKTFQGISRSSSFIRSSLILQEGLEILESPFLVKTTLDLNKFTLKSQENSLKVESKVETDKKLPANENSEIHVKINGVSFMDNLGAEANHEKRIEINTEDGTAILFGPGISSKISPPAKPSLCRLEDVPMDIRCRVYLQILSKIIQSENTLIYNEDWSTYLYDQYRTTRNELLQDVVDTIASIQDNDLVIEGLNLLSKDRISPPRNPYRDKLTDEALIRATNGHFSVEQIVQTIKSISSYHDRRYREAIDLIWPGIQVKEDDINPKNYIALVRTLDFFGDSQKVVKIICEKKLKKFWPELKGSELAEVGQVFQDSLSSSVAQECLERWAASRMIDEKESDVTIFIKSLTATRNYSKDFEKAIEAYLKTKDIKNPVLIASIMNYCESLRIRNPEILNVCADYLTKNGNDIPDPLLSSIFVPFGYLNYNVPSAEFWTNFEKILKKKFNRLSPNDAVNILLSCAYLQKYSPQFSSKVFKSRFTRRVKSREKLMEKLKLLDKCMAIEYEHYTPHFTNEKIDITVATRPKLRRVISLIYPELLKFTGNKDCISKSVIFSDFVNDHNYIVDAIVHSTPTSPVFRIDDGANAKTAVLIHLPEDYCRDTGILIGPRLMRTRHLRKLGLSVVMLDYSVLLNCSGESERMFKYLSERFQEAEHPL